MAFSAAASSGYAPGSIAARPVRKMGGVRRQNETPAQFDERMASRGAFTAAAQGPTRADKIAEARANGGFDMKRAAFNAANKGSYMDSTGTIGPKAEMPTAITPASPAPMSPASPSPAPAAATMGPPKPRGPAMFDGKPKAKFFADAASRGVGSMPSGVYDQPEIAAKIKSRDAAMATPSMAGAAADTRGTKQAEALQGAAKSIAAANKIIAENRATRKPMPAAPAPVAAKPVASPPSSTGRSMFSDVMQPVSRAVTQAGAEAANLGRLEKEAAAAKKARRGFLTNASEAVASKVDAVVDSGASAVKSGMSAAGKVAKAIPKKIGSAYNSVKTGLFGSDDESEAEKALKKARQSPFRFAAAAN